MITLLVIRAVAITALIVLLTIALRHHGGAVE